MWWRGSSGIRVLSVTSFRPVRVGLNLVERWFGELSQKAIRRGAFVSVPDLIQAIEVFLAAWNESPRPFVWTATVENNVTKIARARAKLEQLKPGCTQPRQRKSNPQ